MVVVVVALLLRSSTHVKPPGNTKFREPLTAWRARTRRPIAFACSEVVIDTAVRPIFFNVCRAER